MAYKELYETEGIVLSDRKYKESSTIVHLYTKDLGKISMIVAGALRAKSRLLLACKQFVKASYSLSLSKGRYYIRSAKVIDSNLGLAKDTGSFLIGQFICEIVDRTMAENYKDPRIYGLMDSAFKALKEGSDPSYIKSGFLIKYLSFIGLRPNLRSCQICQSTNLEDLVFSKEYGGLICKSQLQGTHSFVKLTRSDLDLMNKLLYQSFSDYENMGNIAKIEPILVDFFKYNTEIQDIKSEKIYKNLINI